MATTDRNLHRSVLREDFPGGTMTDAATPAPGLLFPDFYERQLDDGSTRQPDVTLLADEGVEWVKAGGGTSLWDVPRVFKAKKWLHFEIPSGTKIPASLKVHQTHYSDRFKANHYQIESQDAWMRKDAFQGALENFARNAIARAVELATGTSTV